MVFKEKMSKKIDPEKIYTTGEVAKLLGVTVATVRYWIRKGWIDGIRFGGRYKILGEALLAFFDKEYKF